MVTYVAELTSENFNEKINSSPIVIVDVWAKWCVPCASLSPIIDEVGAELGESVLVGKIDADAHLELVKELGVRNIPTILYYKNGEIVDRSIGVKSKNEIISTVQSHM